MPKDDFYTKGKKNNAKQTKTDYLIRTDDVYLT
jgi:hypothetical protein